MSTFAGNIAAAASVVPARTPLCPVRKPELRRSTGLIVQQCCGCNRTGALRILLTRPTRLRSKFYLRRSYQSSHGIPKNQTISQKQHFAAFEIEQGRSEQEKTVVRHVANPPAPVIRHIPWPLAVRKKRLESNPVPDRVQKAKEPMVEVEGREQRLELEIKRLLQQPKPPLADIFDIYSNNSRPDTNLLSEDTMTMLLYKFSLAEPKDWTAMLRYLHLAQDMKVKYRPLESNEWNSAIAFAGQCLKTVDESRVEATLEIWREMEREAKFKTDIVTFNILLDVAIKARKFRLVDMILREIRRRELRYTRHTYTSIMYLNGLQNNLKGVRLTYKNFIEAGGIVDTAIVNCLILSLIKSGTDLLVRQVYAFLNRKLVKAAEIPIRYPRFIKVYHSHAYFRKQQERWFGRILQLLTNSAKTEREQQNYQNRIDIRPDDKTFKIMVYHFALQRGDFDFTWELFRDMQTLFLPLSGRIFVTLFKAFKVHGGVPGTKWTCERLEIVWRAFLKAVDGFHPSAVLSKINDCDPDGVSNWTNKQAKFRYKPWAHDAAEPLHFSPATAELSIRAFVQCAGPERAGQVWTYEIEPRWRATMTAQDSLQSHSILASIGYHAQMKAAVQQVSVPISYEYRPTKQPAKQPVKNTIKDDIEGLDDFWSFSYGGQGKGLGVKPELLKYKIDR